MDFNFSKKKILVTISFGLLIGTLFYFYFSILSLKFEINRSEEKIENLTRYAIKYVTLENEIKDLKLNSLNEKHYNEIIENSRNYLLNTLNSCTTQLLELEESDEVITANCNEVCGEKTCIKADRMEINNDLRIWELSALTGCYDDTTVFRKNDYEWRTLQCNCC